MSAMTWGMRISFAAGTLLLAAALVRLDAGGLILKKEEIPKAINKLKTGTDREKADAAEAIGHRGSLRASDVKEAMAPLREALFKEKDERVRAAAAKALGAIGSEPQETVMLLLKALQADKSDNVKSAAIIGIGRMPSEAAPAVPEIRRIAMDKKNKKLSNTARQVLKTLKVKKK
jgi:HEAT repeat protein